MSNTEPLSGGIKVLLVIVTILIPIVGLILGIIYLNNPVEENKKFGKLLLILSIVIMVLICICAFVLPMLGMGIWSMQIEGILRDLPGY